MPFLEANMYRDGIEPRSRYAEDRKKRKEADKQKDIPEHGDKLLCAPFYWNVLDAGEFIKKCKKAAKRVPKNAKPFCEILHSYGIGIVRSPMQHSWAIKTTLQFLSPLASIIVDGKHIPFDMEQVLLAAGFHCNTDNSHSHANALLADLITGKIVHLNPGWRRQSGWKLAFAFARQELARAQGQDVPQLYKLLANGDGTHSLEIDQNVVKKLAAKNASLSEAEKERRKYQPKSDKRKSVAHRAQIDPVELFRALINKHYPDGPPQTEKLPPPPPLPTTIEGPVTLWLSDETNPQARQYRKDFSRYSRELDDIIDRNNAVRKKLKDLLRQNEMSIATTEHGGLLACVHRQHAQMSEVDERWTRETLATILDAKNRSWTVGKPEQYQKTEVKETFQQWRLSHEDPTAGVPGYNLPWVDYQVEIKRLSGTTLRKDAPFDAKLRTEYQQHLNGDRRAGKGQRAVAANLLLRPVMQPGELAIAVGGIPGEKVEYCREHYQPALLIKNHEDDFTAVFIVTYDPGQRWEAMNTRAALSHALCLELDGTAWSDGFLAPGVPQLIGSDYVSPEIIGLPNKKVSVMVQARMPAVWAKLYQEELAWRQVVNRIEEERFGLAPGKLDPDLTVYPMPRFEPLRRGGPAAQPALEEKPRTAVLDPVLAQARTPAKKAAAQNDHQPGKKAEQKASASSALDLGYLTPGEDRQPKLRRMRRIIKLGLFAAKQNDEAIRLSLATEPGLSMELVSVGENVLQVAAERGLMDAFEAFARDGREPAELLSVWNEAMQKASAEKTPAAPECDFVR